MVVVEVFFFGRGEVMVVVVAGREVVVTVVVR